MAKSPNLLGMQFGNWLVIDKAEPKWDRPSWLCECQCCENRTKRVFQAKMLTGQNYPVSCGCIPKKCRKKKHGLEGTRIYRIWGDMKRRCYNKKCEPYKNYGGRGIKVCDEWYNKENGFINFYNWAINNGYAENLTIDRIDVNGNYEPSNCRWATDEEQANNKRNSIHITYNNETHSMSEWSKKLNINVNAISYRYYNYKDLDIDPKIILYGTRYLHINKNTLRKEI